MVENRYYNLRTRLAVRITSECVKFVNGRPIYVAVMSQPTDSNGQYVRRVTLPSGRSIEVVYFEPLAAEAAGAARPSRRSTTCTSAPSAIATSSTPWTGRRPPSRTGRSSCAAPTASGTRSARTTRPPSTASTSIWTSGTEALVKDLRRLVQANMEAEAERFAAALDANAILPEDF